MGYWLLMTLVPHLGSLYGPLTFLHLLQVFTQLLTSWHTALQKTFILQEPLYALSFVGPTHHVAVVVLGLCKLLVISIDDIWSPELHKFDEVSFSKLQMIKLAEIPPDIFGFFCSNL